MNDRGKTAKRYREYAEELRVIAADKQVRENRDALLKIAKDYERMASTLEAMHDVKQVIQNSVLQKPLGRA
ncbi:MAG TPA: hypothetical protein VEU06_11845 [Micropepsaceae bacterium]|nr:hypothetical protein [Micropepsaceae bacterium]